MRTESLAAGATLRYDEGVSVKPHSTRKLHRYSPQTRGLMLGGFLFVIVLALLAGLLWLMNSPNPAAR